MPAIRRCMRRDDGHAESRQDGASDGHGHGSAAATAASPRRARGAFGGRAQAGADRRHAATSRETPTEVDAARRARSPAVELARYPEPLAPATAAPRAGPAAGAPAGHRRGRRRNWPPSTTWCWSRARAGCSSGSTTEGGTLADAAGCWTPRCWWWRPAGLGTLNTTELTARELRARGLDSAGRRHRQLAGRARPGVPLQPGGPAGGRAAPRCSARCPAGSGGARPRRLPRAAPAGWRHGWTARGTPRVPRTGRAPSQAREAPQAPSAARDPRSDGAFA